MIRIALACCLVGFSLMSIHADDVKDMNSDWIVEKAIIEGTNATDAFKPAVLSIKDGKFVLTFGTIKDEGTLSLNDNKSPKQMDIKGTEGPNKGKTLLCIYELKDDSMTVCYHDKERPIKLESTKDNKCNLITYKKKKS
jgi:uncharacterized protein (TIGR03067 family)